MLYVHLNRVNNANERSRLEEGLVMASSKAGNDAKRPSSISHLVKADGIFFVVSILELPIISHLA